MQFLSKTGLTYFTNKIKTLMETKVDKIEGKGLSTNDYTTAEKTKLSGIEDGANKTIVDSDLNENSTNPVENRVVVDYLNQAINIAIEQSAINMEPALSGINSSLDNKQDKLTAGEGISIVNDIISATASGGGSSGTGVTYISDNSSSNPFILADHEPGLYVFAPNADQKMWFKGLSTNTSYTSQQSLSNLFYLVEKPTDTTTDGTIVGIIFDSTTGGALKALTYKASRSSGLSAGNYGVYKLVYANDGTISAEYTFSTLPKSSVVPTEDTHLVNKAYVDETKQDVLTAGTGITIVDNVISATASGDSGNESITDGRNLILDADFTEQSDFGIYTFSNGEVTFSSETGETTPNLNRFKMDLTEYGKSIIRNKTITFSMEYMVTEELVYNSTGSGPEMQLTIMRDDTTGGGKQWLRWVGSDDSLPTAVSSEWTKRTATWVVTDYDFTSIYCNVIVSNTSGTIKFRNPKLEIGETATPWSLAPEDIESDLKSLKDRLTALEASM